MTTNELQQDIQRPENRLAELVAEIETAHGELVPAESDLIDGGLEAGDTATRAQARLTGLVVRPRR